MTQASKARRNRRRSFGKALPVKGSRVGDDLVEAFEQMARHLRGEIALKAHELPGGVAPTVFVGGAT